MTSYGPGDALWQKQIDDLTRLYWRRHRLERAQAGLMRRARLAVEAAQHRRRQEMVGATFSASQPEMLEVDTTTSRDRGVRLRKLLSLLEVVRAQVKQRTFGPRQRSQIESLYGGYQGWRQARLLHLLALFNKTCAPGAEAAGLEMGETARPQGGPQESAVEPQYQELLRLLEEESAAVQEEFEYEEKLNEEKLAIERDAALAPVGEGWSGLVRQQGALDRSIDRKVRILIALRKEWQSASFPNMPPREELGRSRGGIGGLSRADIMSNGFGASGTDENTKLQERSLNVTENKGSLWKTGERSGDVVENADSYPQNGGMLLKGKEFKAEEKAEAGASRDNLSLLGPALHDPSGAQPLPLGL